MGAPRLAFKVDVDTDRGTRIGVPALLDLFAAKAVPANFLFSLGPDNTGRAIRRVFRKGFLGKVGRTNVVGTYGLRTLMNGVLLPGPDIARRNAGVMRRTAGMGFSVGIHTYDHIRWQDGLGRMSLDQTRAEFGRARAAFERVFGHPAPSAGAAGWQANENSLAVYDEAGLVWASDARGPHPFRPRAGGRVFRTPQLPTTLPTLDELIGRPEYPNEKLAGHLLSLLRPDHLEVFTLHAEIEGMSRLGWFGQFIEAVKAQGVEVVDIDAAGRAIPGRVGDLPVCDLVQGSVDGRSGTLAVQAA